MRRALLAAVAIAALGAPAEAQRAMAPAARAKLDRGLRAYADQDWRAAIEAFRAGYDIDPHPDFLFPWAQATRLSGDCAGAIPLYRRALESVKSEEDRRDIEKLIAGCEEEVERTRPPPTPEEEPPPRAIHHPPHRHVHAPSPPAAEREPAPWYTDVLGGALAITGALALGGGAAFLVAARRADDDAAAAGTLDGFVSASDTADQRRVIGAVALGAGAGLAAVAVLRYAWVGHRAAREPEVAVAPAPGGGAVVGVWARF